MLTKPATWAMIPRPASLRSEGGGRFHRNAWPVSPECAQWLETVPSEFRDRCTKSEKGVDIEICCDALKLAALGKLDRLALLTNDGISYLYAVA